MINILSDSSINFNSTAGYSNMGYYISTNITGQFVSMCCKYAIFTSQDSGTTFSKTTFTTEIFAIKMSNSGQYQCAISTGIPSCNIYMSNDYGVTWINKQQNLTINNSGRWVQSICMDNSGQYIYCSGGGWAGIQSYYSTDYGNNWTMIDYLTINTSCAMNSSVTPVLVLKSYQWSGDNTTDGISYCPFGSNGTKIHSKSGILRIVSDNTNNFVYCTYNSLFMSNDNGTTWSQINNPNINGSIIHIAYNGLILCCCDNNNLYITKNNGTTWDTYNLTSNENIIYFDITQDNINNTIILYYVTSNNILYKYILNIKSTPIIIINPTASSIEYGQTLSSSTLSGGSSNVNGSFEFSNLNTVLNASENQLVSVIFTPLNTNNYNLVTLNINIIVKILRIYNVPIITKEQQLLLVSFINKDHNNNFNIQSDITYTNIKNFRNRFSITSKYIKDGNLSFMPLYDSNKNIKKVIYYNG